MRMLTGQLISRFFISGLHAVLFLIKVFTQKVDIPMIICQKNKLYLLKYQLYYLFQQRFRCIYQQADLFDTVIYVPCFYYSNYFNPDLPHNWINIDSGLKR